MKITSSNDEWNGKSADMRTPLADEARRVSGPAGVEFAETLDAESIGDAWVVHVREFEEDNQVAARLRDEEIRPRIERGARVVVDFEGVRSPTQSFVHALLYEVFKVPGSLVRLTFLRCTPSAREVVKAVAAYASYRQIV